MHNDQKKNLLWQKKIKRFLINLFIECWVNLIYTSPKSPKQANFVAQYSGHSAISKSVNKIC